MNVRNTKDTGKSYANKVTYNIRRLALKDGHRFELTDAEIISTITLPCHYCGSEPSLVRMPSLVCNGKFPVNGIDRVDSSEGYTASNTVPCCLTCNRMKRDHSANEFIAHCKRIANHATT